MLPDEFPKWRTVHSHFAIWSEPREGGSLLEQTLKKSDWRDPQKTGAQRLQHALDSLRSRNVKNADTAGLKGY